MKYKVLKGLLTGVAHMPLRMMYGISDLAAFILYRVVKYRIGVVRKNLRMAFPELSEKDRRRIERHFYRHLCDVFVETGKLAHISDREIDRRVKIEGVELINESVEKGRSVVLLLGHFGNWEWVTAMARYIDHRAVMCEVYHPLRDKAFDRLMLDLRSRFGTENIPMKRTVRRLVRINKEGGSFVCGFISDQRPFTPELKHWTNFLGIDTAYVNGGEVVGNMLDADFLYVEMAPEKRGHYKITVSRLQPLDDGEENPVTRAYLRALESSIRRHPSHWLWSHNRWKRTRPNPPVHTKEDAGGLPPPTR